MKGFLIVLLTVFLIFMAGCNKDNGSPTEPTPQPTPHELFQGKYELVKWISDDGDSIKIWEPPKVIGSLTITSNLLHYILIMDNGKVANLTFSYEFISEGTIVVIIENYNALYYYIMDGNALIIYDSVETQTWKRTEG